MSKITVSNILLGNGETITKYHNNLNQLHRLDAPAVETSYSKEWWNDGKLHRLDGPAILINKQDYIRAEWWTHGLLYRNNKPAIVDTDGNIEYWENGNKIK